MRRSAKTLVAGGGKLIDTALSYGTAERVVGDLLAATGLNGRVFLATELEEHDRNTAAARLHAYLQRLRTDRIDLIQLHNVSDPRQDLSILREWKSRGLCRYFGITTSSGGDFDAVEAVARRQKPDFLQVNCPRHRRRGTGGIAKMRRDRLGPWLSSLEPTSLQKQRKLRFCPRIASIPWHNSI